MRVYRSVCTYIWYDDKFPFASDDCQLVWFHIFTHPLSTQFGLVPHSVEGLAADKNRNKMWPLKRYSEAFQEGIQLGFFEYDPQALLIYFPKYFSDDNNQNRPSSPNTVIAWAERWKTIPESPLKHKCYQSVKSMIEGMSEAFRKAYVKAWPMALLMPSPIQEPKPEPKPEPKEDGKMTRSVRQQTHTVTDNEWVQTLKDDPLYRGIDIDTELRKAQSWIKTNGKGRQFTRKFFGNWLVRAMNDKPITVTQKARGVCL